MKFFICFALTHLLSSKLFIGELRQSGVPALCMAQDSSNVRFYDRPTQALNPCR
jgi:hypothetical protein